eukprot:SM000196S05360  [mRNA]  locus=s196:35282:37749:- [translate_table: standard]
MATAAAGNAGDRQRRLRKDVIVTTQVLSCEVAKALCALALMAWDGSLRQVAAAWSARDALAFSAMPAAIYAMQNLLLQLGYRNLDYLTFNMLNQSKLLFTALFMFLFLQHRQSRPQIAALLVMLVASVLLVWGQHQQKHGAKPHKMGAAGGTALLLTGILPVALGAIFSGMGSTFCQWVMQVKRRSNYLMTMEMAVIASMLLSLSLLSSPDGQRIRMEGYFHAWTPLTLIPVGINALGGIIVGLVTKYVGGVKKGIAIVAALAVTAVLQVLVDGAPISPHVFLALPLVVTSTIVHSKFPYINKPRHQFVAKED